MPYVKLDTGILNSTLWVERECREIFITALLMAEPVEIRTELQQIEIRSLKPTGWVVPPGWYGFVPAAGPGIIRRAIVDQEAGTAALERLGAPDHESRSSDFEGRRLIRVDGGFVILNFFTYRDRDYTSAIRSARYRERQASRRDSTSSRSQSRESDATPRDITQAVSSSISIKETTLSGKPDGFDLTSVDDKLNQLSAETRAARELAKVTIAYLNLKAGTRFPETRRNVGLVEARILRDRATEAQLKAVVDGKTAEWGKDPKMRMYLRPATLFGETNWSQYVGQLGAKDEPAGGKERVINVIGERDGHRGAIDSFMHTGALNGIEVAKRFMKSHSRLIKERDYDVIAVQDTSATPGTVAVRYSIEELK